MTLSVSPPPPPSATHPYIRKSASTGSGGRGRAPSSGAVSPRPTGTLLGPAAAPPLPDLSLPDPAHTRHLYSRFTLLGLSGLDTLKQQWTGEIFVEFLCVLENSKEALQHAIGRELPPAIGLPSDLLPRGSIFSFPFKPEQHQAHQRQVMELREEQKKRHAVQHEQALKQAQVQAQVQAHVQASGDNGTAGSPLLQASAGTPLHAPSPSHSTATTTPPPAFTVEDREAESVDIVRDLFPLKVNNMVEEAECEHWVKKHSLLVLEGQPSPAAVVGLRPWKLFVQTSLPLPTLESLGTPYAAALPCVGGAGAQQAGARRGSEGGFSGGDTAAASPAASPRGGAKAFRAATVGELLLEAKWRHEQELAEEREKRVSFAQWLGTLVREERRREAEEHAADQYLRVERLESDIMNDLMMRTMKMAREENPLREVVQRFCVLSYNVQYRGAFEHSFELESFPSDSQHPFVDFSLKTAVNEYAAGLMRRAPPHLCKWGATFCLPREARSHEIKCNQREILVEEDGVEKTLQFDYMRVWDFRKSNLENLCVRCEGYLTCG